MASQFYPIEDDQERIAAGRRALWSEIRRMADELELEVHLAGMDVHDRWRALEPRLVRLERQLKSTGRHASKMVAKELAGLRALLVELRDDVRDGN